MIYLQKQNLKVDSRATNYILRQIGVGVHGFGRFVATK
jgi:hypothetical protein